MLRIRSCNEIRVRDARNRVFVHAHRDGFPWDVDGNPITLEDSAQPDTDKWRGRAWGCERPELVLSESAAWHDRQTEDTDRDSGPGNGQEKFSTNRDGGKDEDFDQVGRPQGALFVELYNPWPRNEGNF